jgi:hypothetical protein
MGAELAKTGVTKQSTFDKRWARAEEIGWTLDGSLYAGTSSAIFVMAPLHFDCRRHQWAAYWNLVDLNGQTVHVPHWFWDDHVLTHGRWNSRCSNQ